MSVRKFFLILAPACLAVAGLLLCAALLPSQAAASAELLRIQKPDGLIDTPSQPPEPRWLALVQASPRHALHAGELALNYNLTDHWLAGFALGSSPVGIRHTRQDALVAEVYVTPMPVGEAFFYSQNLSWDAEECSLDVCVPLTGDVLWVSQASQVVSLTLPVLTALAESPDNQVYGESPPSSPLHLTLFPYDEPEASYSLTVTSTLAGDYQALWAPGHDLRPRDWGYIRYSEDEIRQVYARWNVPFLRVQIGNPIIDGFSVPGSAVTVAIHYTSDGYAVSTKVTAGTDGWFFAHPYDYAPRMISAGDVVTAAAAGQTFSLTVQTLTVQADHETDTLIGSAPPNASLEIWSYKDPSWQALERYYPGGYNYSWWLNQTPDGSTVVTANPAGDYALNLPLQPGDYGAVLLTSPEGHQSHVDYVSPYLWIPLGLGWGPYNEIIYGQVESDPGPITVSLRGPSGYLKDFIQDNAYDWGVLNVFIPNGLTLENGDQLMIANSQGVLDEASLPLLTVQVNLYQDTVFGQAPPGAHLEIGLNVSENPWDEFPNRPSWEYTRIVTATAQGDYEADFSSLVDLEEEVHGEVWLDDGIGHRFVHVFDNDAICWPRIETVWTPGNEVVVDNPNLCKGAVLRLRDHQGMLKAETAISGYSAWINFLENDIPVPILPGDSLQLLSRGEIKEWIIPELSASLNPELKRVSGTAPANAALRISIYYASSFMLLDQFEILADSGGNYVLDLPVDINLSQGDWAQVDLLGLPLQFSAAAVLPAISTILNSTMVYGSLPPLTHYTSTAETGEWFCGGGGYARSNGFFSYDCTMEFIIAPGTQITVTTPGQIFDMVVQSLSAYIDRETGAVTGQAPPSSQLRVFLLDALRSEYRDVTSSTAGEYSADFSSLLPLSAPQGQAVHLDSDGNRSILLFTSPTWQIQLGENYVNGTASHAGEATLELQASNGSYTESVTVNPGGPEAYYNVGFQHPIRSGDRLTLIEIGHSTTYQVPLLSTQFDNRNFALVGKAPPGSTLIFAFWAENYWDSTPRHTLADASGNYGIDISDLEIDVRLVVTLYYQDQDGNQVALNFIVAFNPAFLPLITQP